MDQLYRPARELHLLQLHSEQRLLVIQTQIIVWHCTRAAHRHCIYSRTEFSPFKVQSPWTSNGCCSFIRKQSPL